MDVFVYDAIFGYVNHVAVVWCVFILEEGIANVEVKLHKIFRLMRFRYLEYWHPE